MRTFSFLTLPFLASSSSCATCGTQEADEASLLQSRVRSASDPDDDADAPSRTYKEDFSDYQHRVNSQVELVQAKVTFDTTNTITIKKENNAEHGTHSMFGSLAWAKYSQHRVCAAASDAAAADVEAAHNGYYVPEFTLDEPICFNKLWIGYLAGSLSCNADGKSHFGCETDAIGLVLMKKSDSGTYEAVFPKADDDWNVDNIQGYSSTTVDGSSADWYKLSSYTGTETALSLKVNPSGNEGGGVFLKKGTYQLWYNENHDGGAEENDNSGVACFHLDFSLCQGTHDSSFSIETVTAPPQED